MSTVRQNLMRVTENVLSVYKEAPQATKAAMTPCLVAVSKTKPKEMIMEAYDCGHRHFGENYVQELWEKASDPILLEKCPEIKWHFIGNCQIKNGNKLARCPNLEVVETIVSTKLADKLQQQMFKLGGKTKIIQVMVQVNTSGEESKNGVQPGKVVEITKHIIENCPNLTLVGLMTIGALGSSVASKRGDGDPNPDFLTLINCRRQAAEAMGVTPSKLQLSMGMSNDYEEAIRMGSTNIRVGSSIFGSRSYVNAKPPSTDDSNNKRTQQNEHRESIDQKLTTLEIK